MDYFEHKRSIAENAAKRRAEMDLVVLYDDGRITETQWVIRATGKVWMSARPVRRKETV